MGTGTSVRLAEDSRDFQGILDLQTKNLERSLSPSEAAQDGFVTVRHDLSTLRKMHAAYPSVVATHDGRIVGYVIMMAPEFRALVPAVEAMFNTFDTWSYRGRPLREHRFFVNGQVCVDRAFRGTGVFDAMFARFRESYASVFDLVVTEIAARNVRSRRAHERVGFRAVHAYVDPRTAEHWDVVLWDWLGQ